MLSLCRCRELLGAGCRLTDEELQLLRDQLYALAKAALSLHDGEREDAD
jgi:hypothetical protein